MSEKEVPMADTYLEDGTILKGIESYVPKEQYQTDEYQYAIVDNIKGDWLVISRNRNFMVFLQQAVFQKRLDIIKDLRKKCQNLELQDCLIQQLIIWAVRNL